MGRAARAYTGRAALPFVLAICAVGVFLSHPVLGRIWHPPVGSPFAAATPNQFHRVFSSRYPGGSILAYRVVGPAGLALTETGQGLSVWEARVREGNRNSRPTQSVVLSRQIPQLTKAADFPVAVSQLTSPPVLVAYVSNRTVWSEEGKAVIRWSDGRVSRVVLAGQPRAWILPPPPGSAPAGGTPTPTPTWQSVELLNAFGGPIVTLTPKGTTWAPRPLSTPTGYYAMPGASPW